MPSEAQIEAVARAIYEEMDLSDSLAMPEATRYARVAIEAIAAAEVKPEGWQPIETAPKDGRFLATNARTGVLAITWHGKTSHIPLYGWCCGEDAEDIELWHPTHWMPLPAPPVLSALEGE